MNIIIKNEFVEFQKNHKNINNILFHIVCGFLFMSFFLMLFKKYSIFALIIYSLLIQFTIFNLTVTSIIFIVLYLLHYYFKKFNLTLNKLFILFLVFYFLPDLSHYLTNEPAMLNITNITPLSIFTNIFYLLPFSIMCLSNTQ